MVAFFRQYHLRTWLDGCQARFGQTSVFCELNFTFRVIFIWMYLGKCYIILSICLYIILSIQTFCCFTFQISAILAKLKELSQPALDWGPQEVPSTVHMEEMQKLKPSAENNSNIA